MKNSENKLTEEFDLVLFIVDRGDPNLVKATENTIAYLEKEKPDIKYVRIDSDDDNPIPDLVNQVKDNIQQLGAKKPAIIVNCHGNQDLLSGHSLQLSNRILIQTNTLFNEINKIGSEEKKDITTILASCHPGEIQKHPLNLSNMTIITPHTLNYPVYMDIPSKYIWDTKNKPLCQQAILESMKKNEEQYHIYGNFIHTPGLFDKNSFINTAGNKQGFITPVSTLWILKELTKLPTEKRLKFIETNFGRSIDIPSNQEVIKLMQDNPSKTIMDFDKQTQAKLVCFALLQDCDNLQAIIRQARQPYKHIQDPFSSKIDSEYTPFSRNATKEFAGDLPLSKENKALYDLYKRLPQLIEKPLENFASLGEIPRVKRFSDLTQSELQIIQDQIKVIDKVYYDVVSPYNQIEQLESLKKNFDSEVDYASVVSNDNFSKEVLREWCTKQVIRNHAPEFISQFEQAFANVLDPKSKDRVNKNNAYSMKKLMNEFIAQKQNAINNKIKNNEIQNFHEFKDSELKNLNTKLRSCYANIRDETIAASNYLKTQIQMTVDFFKKDLNSEIASFSEAKREFFKTLNNGKEIPKDMNVIRFMQEYCNSELDTDKTGKILDELRTTKRYLNNLIKQSLKYAPLYPFNRDISKKIAEHESGALKLIDESTMIRLDPEQFLASYQEPSPIMNQVDQRSLSRLLQQPQIQDIAKQLKEHNQKISQYQLQQDLSSASEYQNLNKQKIELKEKLSEAIEGVFDPLNFPELQKVILGLKEYQQKRNKMVNDNKQVYNKLIKEHGIDLKNQMTQIDGNQKNQLPQAEKQNLQLGK